MRCFRPRSSKAPEERVVAAAETRQALLNQQGFRDVRGDGEVYRLSR